MKRTQRRTGYNNRQPGYSIIFDVSTRHEIPWKMYKNYVRPILKYGDIMLSSITEERKAGKIISGAIIGTSTSTIYDELGWASMDGSVKRMNITRREYLCHTITRLCRYINYPVAYRRIKIAIHQILMYVLKSIVHHYIYYWIKVFRFQCCLLQYIPRNMHTVFALLCFVVVLHWLISPYPSG